MERGASMLRMYPCGERLVYPATGSRPGLQRFDAPTQAKNSFPHRGTLAAVDSIVGRLKWVFFAGLVPACWLGVATHLCSS
jgi:hypothetical protein